MEITASRFGRSIFKIGFLQAKLCDFTKHFVIKFIVLSNTWIELLPCVYKKQTNYEVVPCTGQTSCDTTLVLPTV